MTFFTKKELLSIFIVSVMLSFAIFGNGIAGDFVFDDVAVVKNRGDLKDPSYFLNLFISPYHQNMPKTGLYRPLTMASYSINHLLGGSTGLTTDASAAGFHIINIFIHALNSFLVFWLVNFLFKNKFLSYPAFLLFLTHPIHTEAVTSIVGRAELLAFLWGMITLYFFLKNYKLLAAISFLFALWSKETALALLPIFLYVDMYFSGRNFGGSIKRLIFFVIPLGVYSLFRYVALGKYFSGDVTTTVVENQLKFVSFYERIATALKVLYMYIERLVWPVHLSADYSYNQIVLVKNIFKSPEALLGLLILSLFVWLAIYYRKINQSLGLGAVLFILPYLMVSNLIKPVGTIMGERLMYFSSLGFIIILSVLLGKLCLINKTGRKLFYAFLSVIVVLYGARTIIRNNDWADSRTLFMATVRESPNSLITRTALAGIHIRADEWNKAKAELEIARNIYEDNSHLQNLLGIVADHEGNPKLAEESFRKSLALNADAINSHINLAELYLKQKRFEEAGASFLKVIEFYPVAEYVIRYAYAQIAINNPNEAVKVLNRYAGGNLKHPDFSAAIGTAYFVQGDYDQALIYLKNARELGSKTAEVEEMIRISESKI